MTPEAIGTDSQICEEETATMQPKSTEDIDQEAVEEQQAPVPRVEFVAMDELQEGDEVVPAGLAVVVQVDHYIMLFLMGFGSLLNINPC
jgi:hypothetical protein